MSELHRSVASSAARRHASTTTSGSTNGCAATRCCARRVSASAPDAVGQHLGDLGVQALSAQRGHARDQLLAQQPVREGVSVAGVRRHDDALVGRLVEIVGQRVDVQPGRLRQHRARRRRPRSTAAVRSICSTAGSSPASRRSSTDFTATGISLPCRSSRGNRAYSHTKNGLPPVRSASVAASAAVTASSAT